MRIGIDGIAMSQPQPGGFRTYTLGLVEALSRLDAVNEYVLFVDRPITLQLPENWQIRVIAPVVRGVGVAWREQVSLPRAAAEYKLDVLHCPWNTGPAFSRVRVVCTMHDTIEYSEPLPPIRQTRRRMMRIYSRAFQRILARKAAHIITGSVHAKGRLIECLGIPVDRITVVPDAVSPLYRPLDKMTARRFVERLHGVSEYVLAMASLAPRKNITTLLAAYAGLERETRLEHPLLLVCTQAAATVELEALATRLGCSESVHFVVRPTDDELLMLYNAATVFAFPSLEEGFGLPPLEAMACGTPVLSSNLSAMPEVLGDAPLYCDPLSEQSIREGLLTVLGSVSLRSRLSELGLARSRVYSWDRAAQRTLQVYQEVLGLS